LTVEPLEERRLLSYYSVGELVPLPGHTIQRAYDINQAGQAVGKSYSPGAGMALWQTAGQVVELANTLGVPSSSNDATGINDRGAVVGSFLKPGAAWPNSFDAFLWTPNVPNGPTGSMIDLGFSVLQSSDSRGGVPRINNQGVVIGNQVDSTNTLINPVVWQNGASMNLNQLLPAGSGWNLTSANGLNATEIVGQGVLNGVTQAYLYVDDDGNFLNGGGQVHALIQQPVQGSTFNAYAISSNGKVAGSFGIWTPAVPNGTIGTTQTGFGFIPRAINDSGYVVGQGPAPNYRAMVKFAGAPSQTLNTLKQGQIAFTPSSALGITGTGVILAEYSSQHAFRLTPSATPLPTVSINSVSNPEGNSGTTAFTFTVSLSAPSTTTVTIGFSTSDGTAVSYGTSIDYEFQSGWLTFAPGETSKTITILVYGDTRKENNETFYVNLNNFWGATLGIKTGLGTILNDD
jgi:hypothetical protein